MIQTGQAAARAPTALVSEGTGTGQGLSGHGHVFSHVTRPESKAPGEVAAQPIAWQAVPGSRVRPSLPSTGPYSRPLVLKHLLCAPHHGTASGPCSGLNKSVGWAQWYTSIIQVWDPSMQNELLECGSSGSHVPGWKMQTLGCLSQLCPSLLPASGGEYTAC